MNSLIARNGIGQRRVKRIDNGDAGNYGEGCGDGNGFGDGYGDGNGFGDGADDGDTPIPTTPDDLLALSTQLKEDT